MLRFLASLLLCSSWLAILIAAAEGQPAPSSGGSSYYKDAASRLHTSSSTHQKKSKLPRSKNQRRRQIFDHAAREHRPDEEPACRDLHSDCRRFAAAGGCGADPVWMHPHCPVACGACDRLVRLVPRGGDGDDGGMMEPPTIPPGPIADAIGAGLLGVPQRLVSDEHAARIAERVAEAVTYLRDTVLADDLYEPVRETCQTHDAQCAYWAAIQGECETNPDFMNEHCAPVCFACDQLHVLTRCPIDPNEKSAWYAGDLNKMFENIVSSPEFNAQYDIQVLSRPDYAEGDDPETANYILGPWILTLDNFLSAEEAERLIELGRNVGYERSTDVGAVEEDGTVERKLSQGRTSTNAWCLSEECLADPVALAVYERMENLTGIPTRNSEALQLLRYTESQFYNVHHDYIPLDKERTQGVRILTIFLYLNDMPDESSGGGTNFDRLDLTVNPKMGRALVWPSTLNDFPNEMDPATHHQALPVNKGIKYGANAWFHQRSYPEDSRITRMTVSPAANAASPV